MFFILNAAFLAVVAIVGFSIARRFVIQRMRFVDAIQAPLAPVLAGIGAAIVAWPLAILPIITTGTAAIFGISAGLGTASGRKALRRGSA